MSVGADGHEDQTDRRGSQRFPDPLQNARESEKEEGREKERVEEEALHVCVCVCACVCLTILISYFTLSPHYREKLRK